jgi:hypothetical protein
VRNQHQKTVMIKPHPLHAAVRAYWNTIDALVNTYEYQKKSAQEQVERDKKVIQEEKIIEFILTRKMTKEQEDFNILMQERIDYYYEQLKKNQENSFPLSAKTYLDEQNGNNIREAYNLSKDIEKYDKIIFSLREKIERLDKKIKYSDDKIKHLNNEIRELDHKIEISISQNEVLHQQRLQAIEEFLFYTNKVSQFDLAMLESDDNHLIEIIHQGVEIIDIGHDKIMSELRIALVKTGEIDKEVIKRKADDIIKSVLQASIRERYSFLKPEEISYLIDRIASCRNYEEKIQAFSEESLMGKDTEKFLGREKEFHERQSHHEKEIQRFETEKQQKINEKQKEEAEKQEASVEKQKAEEKLSNVASQKAAALNKLKQLKEARAKEVNHSISQPQAASNDHSFFHGDNRPVAKGNDSMSKNKDPLPPNKNHPADQDQDANNFSKENRGKKLG